MIVVMFKYFCVTFYIIYLFSLIESEEYNGSTNILFRNPCFKNNCQPGRICKNKECVCKSGFYEEHERCKKCPPHGEVCRDLCCGENLLCINGICQYTNEDVLQYATALALGTALILGVVALGTLVWKICISSYRVDRYSRRRLSINSVFSINSVQRLVNERLRDRPPTYVDAVTTHRHTNQLRIPETAEPPPPYSLFCRQEENNVTFSNVDNLDQHIKENSVEIISTNDTAIHM